MRAFDRRCDHRSSCGDIHACFAGHLEKSRETVDLANVRSAYSEVMTAVMTEDTENYSRTVKLKQKRDNWNAYDPVTVAGIMHSRDEGDTEHWIGIPVENGECTLSYIPDFGMKIIWSGAGGNDTPLPFPYNDDLHGALNRTDVLEELKNQNNTYFEIDSKCPKSDMLPRVNEEIRKEGSSSLLGTGTWVHMGSPNNASRRYLFWTSMDTDQVGAGKKIPVIVSRADGGFYISETTTAERKMEKCMLQLRIILQTFPLIHPAKNMTSWKMPTMHIRSCWRMGPIQIE